MKIYVASSWRNTRQPEVVDALRVAGHEVYDFRNPKPGDYGFSWQRIHANFQNWSMAEYLEALDHPAAEEGFRLHFEAMNWADACVLVAPAGISAHLEFGWACGAGKRTAILLADGEPELMVKMCDGLFTELDALIAWLDMDLVRVNFTGGAQVIGEGVVAVEQTDRGAG